MEPSVCDITNALISNQGYHIKQIQNVGTLYTYIHPYITLFLINPFAGALINK